MGLTEIYNEITELFSDLSNKIKLSNKVNRHDLSVDAEVVIANLMNRLYGFNLKRVDGSYYPAIDLINEDDNKAINKGYVDTNKRVCVQVSSEENQVRKIKRTFKRYIGTKTECEFPKLYFVFLTVGNKCTLPNNFRKPNGFDPKKQVLTFQDLSQKIHKDLMDINKLRDIRKLMQDTIRTSVRTTIEESLIIINKFKRELDKDTVKYPDKVVANIKADLWGTNIPTEIFNAISFYLDEKKREINARLNGELLQIDSSHLSDYRFIDGGNLHKSIFEDRVEIFQLDYEYARLELGICKVLQHSAWMNGDYRRLEDVGLSLISLSGLCQAKFLEKQIGHLGHYLVGEAKRLQITLVREADEKFRLAETAIKSYKESIEQVEDTARSVRGIGKTYETFVINEESYIDRVISQYNQALKLIGESRKGSIINRCLADHEEMRARRHKIEFEVKYNKFNHNYVWKEVAGCIDLHQKLPTVSHDNDWISLEFFMAFVMLGGALSTTASKLRKGEERNSYDLRSRLLLQDALRNRIKLIDQKNPVLDKRLRENLCWWQSKVQPLDTLVARGALNKLEKVLRDDFSGDLINNLSEVAEALVPTKKQAKRKRADGER